MYLSILRLWNFRKYAGADNKPGLEIHFQKGVNVLIGENDSGKTAIVDAIRYVLRTQSGEFIQFEDKDFYQDSDGNNVTGEIKIDGIPYQFAPNGVLQTGFRTVFGKRYYYDPQTGNIRLGWVEWAGNPYYITLSEGKLVNQHRTIDGKRYWFDSYGVATESRCTNYPDADGDG